MKRLTDELATDSHAFLVFCARPRCPVLLLLAILCRFVDRSASFAFTQHIQSSNLETIHRHIRKDETCRRSQSPEDNIQLLIAVVCILCILSWKKKSCFNFGSPTDLLFGWSITIAPNVNDNKNAECIVTWTRWSWPIVIICLGKRVLVTLNAEHQYPDDSEHLDIQWKRIDSTPL